ncbi:phosphotransferase family protein [Embleya scabrispora]|uniref:phosphotransferase family protein n=1 Tax=Embleya scabrispora TaxID=159449 RepID=UPI00037483B6|nr:phosphotransferase [Embleya scabrispora]MYS80767.1 aminoglycoside phosphotransferase [Streptomyces sp. SID5474]
MPHRIQWSDLPGPVRTHLEHALGGRIVDATGPAGGFGHQLAAVLTLASGRRVFVKAAPDDDPLTASNVAEAAVLHALPHRAPAPDPITLERTHGWTVVVIEHLDGPHPDLGPGSPDTAAVPERLDKLAADPADDRYRTAVGTTAAESIRLHGWSDPHLTDLDPWASGRLDRLRDLEQAWPAHAFGDRVVHGDLRADNMVRDRIHGPVFVDWAHATLGPGWVDLASLAPQLVLAGHRPVDVADLLTGHPLTGNAPDGVDAFLAALTGHWERGSRQGDPARAPGLRAYQRRAAAAGRAPRRAPALTPGQDREPTGC